MILLEKPRMNKEGSIFLKRGYYSLIREIPRLGWLVSAGYTGQTSIIRFDEGSEYNDTSN
jgi:hypothetical protein